MRASQVADFRELARRRLPRLFFSYIDGGSFAEVTLRRNVADFEAIPLRQRVMRDTSALDLGVEVMGSELGLPLVLGPVGMSGMYARRGEVQAARAARAAGVPFCLSAMGVCDAREVSAGAGVPPWFQLYMLKDRGYMRELLARVKAQGCPVLVFTVDLPIPGARYRERRFNDLPPVIDAINQLWGGATHPAWAWDVGIRGRPHVLGSVVDALKGDRLKVHDFMTWIAGNFDRTVTWKDMDWVRQTWDGPIVVKGVLDAEDARDAVRAGAQGLIVSNHGGRQLDGVKSSVAALPAVVDAVGGELEVFMDGGVRSGLDVLRALSLGARACFLGRAWAWALAAGGEAGVARMLEILKAELTVAMVLTGCTSARTAGRELLDL